MLNIWSYRSDKASRSVAQEQQPLFTGFNGVVLLRNLALILFTLVVCGVAATYLSILVTLIFPWLRVNQMVFAVMLMPVLWGSLAYWVCAAERTWIAAAAITTTGAVSACILHGI